MFGFAWPAFSVGLRYASLVGGTTLAYVWLGITTVVVSFGLAFSRAFYYAGLGVSTLVLTISWGLGLLWRGVRAASMGIGEVSTFVTHAIWAGLTTVQGSLNLAVSAIWTGILSVLRPIWLGFSLAITFIVRLTVRNLAWGASVIFDGAGLAVGFLWLGVSVLLRHVWLGIATAAAPLGLGFSRAFYYAGLGVSTLVLTISWGLGLLWRVTRATLTGISKVPAFVARTIWIGSAAVPDISKLAVSAIQNRKEVQRMSSELNLTRERVLSLIATAWVFGVVVIILGAVFWPPPPPPTVEVVHWATGHLFRDDLLPNMAEEFNQAGYRTESGKRIVVVVRNNPSSLQAEDLLALTTTGVANPAECCPASSEPHPDPTIVTPSSAHWLVRVNHQVGRNVVDPDTARSIARAFIGIVTYKEMAECLGWPDKELGYADILELRSDPDGWSKYPCAEPSWGSKPLVALRIQPPQVPGAASFSRCTPWRLTKRRRSSRWRMFRMRTWSIT